MNDIVKPELLSVAERLATLPPEVQALFSDPENGTPDNISKAGCLALAWLEKDAWNAWREVFPVAGKNPVYLCNHADFSDADFRDDPLDFSGFVFGNAADFRRCQFGDEANFQGAQWGGDARFQDAQWGGGANFLNAQWGKAANFQGAQWGEGAEFQCAQWGDKADFQDACWGNDAKFHNTQWGEKANFQRAKWDGDAFFGGAQWCGFADFCDTKWMGAADFSGTSWAVVRADYQMYWKTKAEGDHIYQTAKEWAEERGVAPNTFLEVRFAGAHFADEADFSNRKFTGKTDFGCLPTDYQRKRVQRDASGQAKFDENGKLILEDDPERRRYARFNKAPTFHGCELHQDTSFDKAEFPPASGSDAAARAYRTLKLAFNKQQALREEQRFFKLEMAEEATLSSLFQRKFPWIGVKPLYKLYSLSSDYGFSLWRPLVSFFVVLVIFAFWYGHYDKVPICWSLDTGCTLQKNWLEFSLAQSLPLTGFDKLEVFDPIKKAVPVFVLASHKIISLAYLFLAGLALRNLFRLK